MHQFGFFPLGGSEADAEAPGLVVGAVGGGGDFAELAALTAAGHPGLQVELAIRRAAQVAGRDVHDAVRDAERLVDIFLDSEEAVVHGIGVLGLSEGEHLDLRELVDAVKSAAGAAVGAGLDAEAMAEARDEEGQAFGGDDCVHEDAAEGDLGGGDEAEVEAVDAVDLGLLAAGIEAGAFEDAHAGEVRRGVEDESLAGQGFEGEPAQGEFQKDRLVLEEEEVGPGDLGRAVEVHETERLAEGDVVLGRKVKAGNPAPSAEFAVSGLVLGDGRIGVREVRDAGLLLGQLFFSFGKVVFSKGDVHFEAGGFFKKACGSIALGFADLLADLVASSPGNVKFLNSF